MRYILLILGTFLSAHVFADNIYKCTHENGKTYYSSKACAPEHKTEQINVKTASPSDEHVQETKEQLLAKQKQQEQLEKDQLLKKQTQLKQEALSENAKSQFLIKNNPDKFSVFSIPPYDFDDLPVLVKNHESRLPEIEKFRRQAAEKALAQGQCQRVEASELHSKSTRKILVFLVSCSSGKSFYFTEKELAQ